MSSEKLTKRINASETLGARGRGRPRRRSQDGVKRFELLGPENQENKWDLITFPSFTFTFNLLLSHSLRNSVSFKNLAFTKFAPLSKCRLVLVTSQILSSLSRVVSDRNELWPHLHTSLKLLCIMYIEAKTYNLQPSPTHFSIVYRSHFMYPGSVHVPH